MDQDAGCRLAVGDSRILRGFEIVSQDKEIEIVPGVFFPAWTYKGRVPARVARHGKAAS